MIPFGPANLRAGSGWALASVGVALVSGLVRTIVVARFLGPDAIGLMGIALLSLGFLEAVASTGVDTALVAKRKDAESFIDPAFTIQLTRGLVVLGVTCGRWSSASSLDRPSVRSPHTDWCPGGRARSSRVNASTICFDSADS